MGEFPGPAMTRSLFLECALMDAAQTSTLASLLHAIIVISISFRILMRKPAVGVALAWMFLVAVLPAVGAGFYLLIGERRVGQRRARRIAELRADYAHLAQSIIEKGMTSVAWGRHRPEARGMDRLGMKLIGVPTVRGSSGRLLTEAEEILRAIASDIDSAQKSVLIEFYIFTAGGRADDVLEALIRAGERGVSCRVLIDAIGARRWWKG